MKGPKGQPMMPPGMRQMGPGGPMGPMGPGGPMGVGPGGPMGPGPMRQMGPGPGPPMDGGMGPMPPMDNEENSMDPSSVPSSLSGSKVPNENLNPEQKRKRAEKLGFLQELNQRLFPNQGG